MKKLLFLAFFPLAIACGNAENSDKVEEAPARTDGNQNPPPSRDLIPGHNTTDSTGMNADSTKRDSSVRQ